MGKIEENLIAPCGMNCAVCSGYLSYKNQIPKKTGKIHYCKGCRPRNKECAFLKKKCKDNLKLLRGKVKFCYQCNYFSCDNLVRLDKVYKKNYGMSMIDNLKEIKGKGIEKFIEKQYEKYKCPKCDNLISTHSKKCFVCDKINSWKN